MARLVTLTLLCLLGIWPGAAQPITVTTFAGPQEVPGVSDGQATEARFRTAVGLAVDSQGNVYVADQYNHSIRKVSPSGAVSTLAGHFYLPGQADGSGSVARFDFPRGVATDAADNVYVADTYNDRIRKITPQGMVSTLAGSFSGFADGPREVAQFQRPAGVAAAPDGTVYVADTENHIIRKVSSAGVVSTLAGSPGVAGSANGVGSGARFNLPNALAVDRDGNVYVADTWNHAIRKVTPEGTVTTFCGGLGIQGRSDGQCGAARFAYPAGIAITREGDLYVSDTFNYSIRRIGTNGRVGTVAGSPTDPALVDGPIEAARFDLPQGIAVDGAGTVYVMDGVLRRIRDGEVSRVAGISTAETRRHVDGIGPAARFESPTGIASDGEGNVYVSDDHSVRRITSAAHVTTMAGRPGVDGNANGPATAATFDSLRGIAVDGAGNVYAADAGNNAIRKIAGATVTTFAGPGTPLEGDADGPAGVARFRSPWGVAADGAGNLYVADSGNHTIRKVTSTGAVSTLAGSARQSGSTDGVGGAARFNRPLGVAVDGSGNVYVSDTGNFTVRKVSPSGTVTTLAGLGGTRGTTDGTGAEARFTSLNAIVASRDGTVYVGDGPTLRMITPDGKVTTVAGSPDRGIFFGVLEGTGNADGTGAEAQLASARGLALMPNGDLVMTDNGAVRRGRSAIPDAATGALLSSSPEVLQLDTSAQTATAWTWQVMRRPAGARANLSSATERNPTFRADAPGLFVFRLTASRPTGARVSYLAFLSNVTPPLGGVRRRVAPH
jgi:sugar lactone lactonase YvrE